MERKAADRRAQTHNIKVIVNTNMTIIIPIPFTIVDGERQTDLTVSELKDQVAMRYFELTDGEKLRIQLELASVAGLYLPNGASQTFTLKIETRKMEAMK